MATPAGESSGMTAPAPEAPRVRVADMARTLDFCLDLNCEVREAADGLALLRCGSVSLLLIPAPGIRQHTAVPATPAVRLAHPRRAGGRPPAAGPRCRGRPADPTRRHPGRVRDDRPRSAPRRDHPDASRDHSHHRAARSSPRRVARRPLPPGDPHRTWTSSPTARVSKNRDAASVANRRQPAEGSLRSPSWKAIPPGAKNTA